MRKDVVIEIAGTHALEGDSQNVSAVMRGTLTEKSGKWFLLYEEVTPENPAPVKNTLILAPDRVELIRSGDVRTRMVFEPRQNTVSIYSTPFGNITLTITTESISLREEEGEISAEIAYLLGSNGQAVSSCRLTVKAVPAGDEALRFLEKSFSGKRENPAF